MIGRVFKLARDLQPGDCTAAYKVVAARYDEMRGCVCAFVSLLDDGSVVPKLWVDPNSLVRLVDGSGKLIVEGDCDDCEAYTQFGSVSRSVGG